MCIHSVGGKQYVFIAQNWPSSSYFAIFLGKCWGYNYLCLVSLIIVTELSDNCPPGCIILQVKANMRSYHSLTYSMCCTFCFGVYTAYSIISSLHPQNGTTCIIPYYRWGAEIWNEVTWSREEEKEGYPPYTPSQLGLVLMQLWYITLSACLCFLWLHRNVSSLWGVVCYCAWELTDKKFCSWLLGLARIPEDTQKVLHEVMTRLKCNASLYCFFLFLCSLFLCLIWAHWGITFLVKTSHTYLYLWSCYWKPREDSEWESWNWNLRLANPEVNMQWNQSLQPLCCDCITRSFLLWLILK